MKWTTGSAELSTNLLTDCANTQKLSSFKASFAYKVSPAFAYHSALTIPEGVWMPYEWVLLALGISNRPRAA